MTHECDWRLLSPCGRRRYLLENCEANSECVCITRRIESRVTIPTICGASSTAPLTTGIWLMSALSNRSSNRSRGSSGEVHWILSRGIIADWTELLAHSERG